uniref:phosphoglucomutase (alpha-D-glucose-1,6-bisphosphate-dependent) n=1 Tax=Pyramimonas obovata TaxID=1411642 RepID=A0A7S0RL90_9CHLO
MARAVSFTDCTTFLRGEGHDQLRNPTAARCLALQRSRRSAAAQVVALKKPSGTGAERASIVKPKTRRGDIVAKAGRRAYSTPRPLESYDDLLARYARLQNGSDIRGVALDGVEGEPVTISPAEAFFIARGFAEWIVKDRESGRGVKVSVGRDPRLSGKAIVTAILAGLTSKGITAVDMGLATTPACFMSTISEGYEYDGSMMCTASHLPWNRNGIKFFTPKGGLKKADIAFILQAAATNANQYGASWFLMRNMSLRASVDFLPVYAASLRELIQKGVNHPEHYGAPLKGLKVVVDAGNGSGGFFASMVLEPLGADTSGSQFLDPDGNFPNHVPNPEDAEAMAMTVAAVRSAGADLGVVFDTDVDRSGMVDSSGLEINKNRLIALLAAVTLAEHPGTTIVTDSVTNAGLKEFIAARGGKHFRYMRGYQNVISKGVELNEEGVETHLMIETSGHGAMKENFYLDDGAYLAVKIIIAFMRARLEGSPGLQGLLEGYSEGLEEREYRLGLPRDCFKAEGAKVLAAFHDFIVAQPGWTLEEENHEGWRAIIDEGEGRQGWLLLRQSLHDPLLVLNMESYVEGGCDKIKDTVLKWFEEQVYDVDFSKML